MHFPSSLLVVAGCGLWLIVLVCAAVGVMLIMRTNAWHCTACAPFMRAVHVHPARGWVCQVLCVRRLQRAGCMIFFSGPHCNPHFFLTMRPACRALALATVSSLVKDVLPVVAANHAEQTKQHPAVMF